MQTYHILSHRVQGRGHVKEKIPCQDATYQKQEDNTHIIVLADGAGSARFSHYGSEATSKYVANMLYDGFDRFYESDDLIGVQKEFINGICNNLEILKDEVNKDKQGVKDFKEDLKQLRGSKYVQSEPGQIYKSVRKLLLEDKQVFFLGTPCQVAGLRSFLGKEYQNLFTIDLVCHGVPSPRLFKSYLKSIGVSDKQEYENYYFRNQNNSVYYTNSVKPKDGKSWDIPREKHSYICAYLKGWINRESCYNCHFTGEHRQGDCTICDFWGILSGKTPFKGKVSMGVSMVMTNTEKGKAMFDKIKNQLYFEEKTYEDAIIDNHNLIHLQESN